MAVRFGSREWAEALERELNASSEYRQAASNWGVGFNGNVLLCFEADAAYPSGSSLLIRLEGGTCRGAEFVNGTAHPDAGFALKAPFGLWKDIFERKTLAATAILTGRMKVEGEKMTLLKHTAAHRALVACASAIDTEF
jgi:putative sterol carrier protein